MTLRPKTNKAVIPETLAESVAKSGFRVNTVDLFRPSADQEEAEKDDQYAQVGLEQKREGRCELLMIDRPNLRPHICHTSVLQLQGSPRSDIVLSHNFRQEARPIG
jgi:hypothetical protein